MPFIGGLMQGPTTRMRFPASARTFIIDGILKFSTIAMVVVLLFTRWFAQASESRNDEFARLTGRVSQGPDSPFLTVLLVCLGLYFVFKVLRIFNLRMVGIVDHDLGSAEICFQREDYAKEFCDLNRLVCHSQPFKLRQAARRQ